MIETDRLTDEFLEKFGKDNEYLLADLDKQIAKLYAKYAKDNGLTYLDALKYLTDNEREEFQKDLKFYMEKVWDRAYLKENRAYLQALSVRARVKRLEVLKAEIIKSANKLYGGLSEQIPQHTADIVNMAGKTVTETLKVPELDKAETWGKLAVDDRYIKTILEMPFEGENYSERIWGNCSEFERVLNRTVTNGLVTGKSYNEIAKEMSKKLDVEINKCKRLIATEDTFIANQTSVRTYEENGVKYYKFVARIDQRTSPQCRELNGKIFEVAKAQTGENLPPLHPWCRSVIVPVFEKLDKKGEKEYNKNSGAKLNPNNFEDIEKTEAHAKMYYDEIRNKKNPNIEIQNIFDNVIKYIAENKIGVNISKKDILNIRNYIFIDKHKLIDANNKKYLGRFDLDFDMSLSWFRLIEGKNIQKRDIVLLLHVRKERKLLIDNPNMSYRDAHDIANKKYNYSELCDKYWDNVK